MKNLNKIAEETICSIQKIDFSKLDISDYNRNYINHLLPHIDFQFRIYSDLIKHLNINGNSSDYIIDFGGGHGFLSLFLKRMGISVIYCDHNPLSVKTIMLIKEETGYGPDIILEGSSAKLLSYCKNNGLCPKYLIATDLIEHVYDLNMLFFDFHELNPNLSMIFTTGSVKSNLLKSTRLRKIMIKEEVKVYFPLRKQFLVENYPDFTSYEIDKFAKLTRGLIFSDIRHFVDIFQTTNQYQKVDVDRYNTCDPNTGNWTERILSKNEYRKIISNNQYQVTFKNLFYNEQRNNPVSSFVVKIANYFIRNFNVAGSFLTPLIILIVKGNK